MDAILLWRMFSLLLAALVCLLPTLSHARPNGAGRAFPIDSENYAIDSFRRINPTLSWDETNYLVDLSGHYSRCIALHHPPGVVEVDRVTPQGDSIIGIVDYTDGRDGDLAKVNEYIQNILKHWTTSRIYDPQIEAAKRFGCSVRSQCSGRAVIACLFAPYGDRPSDFKEKDTDYEWERNPTEQPDVAPLLGQQKALAFTREQYTESERIMRRKWDRSHYLENLSGYETDCSMIGTADWPWPYMSAVARMIGVRITGQYGYAPNLGSTSQAMFIVMSRFKPVANARDIGCSIIPHCIMPADRTMHVVVACLYEEQ